MKVGNSERTLGKHVLLNKILGREAGIMSMSCPNFINRKYTIVDMCAGDGRPSLASQTSSPEIIYKHKNFMEKHRLIPDVFLYEKNENTFATLQQRFPEKSIHLNSLSLKSLPNNPFDNSACFIHADPNLISDWPISPELLNRCPKYTTMLITLGCNVGGLKRLKLVDRLKWFECMDSVLRFLPLWHDALLISLKGDSAQWAYLITGPAVWFDRGLYVNDATKAFSYWTPGIDLIQYKSNSEDFFDMRDNLFLTKDEYNAKKIK